jgi:hypothetical protein
MRDTNGATGVDECYSLAVEELLCGDATKYRLEAKQKTDGLELELASGPSYDRESNEVHFDALGTRGGEYTLVLRLSDRRAIHTHGSYDDQGRPSDIYEIEISAA